MATGETGFDDVTFDLISVQYHSLKAGHDYGQYVRDARNAGRDCITTNDAKQATDTLRPGTSKQADYFTLLAVEACNDTELLPARYAALLADRAELTKQIEEAAPAPRRSRTL